MILETTTLSVRYTEEFIPNVKKKIQKIFIYRLKRNFWHWTFCCFIEEEKFDAKRIDCIIFLEKIQDLDSFFYSPRRDYLCLLQ